MVAKSILQIVVFGSEIIFRAIMRTVLRDLDHFENIGYGRVSEFNRNVLKIDGNFGMTLSEAKKILNIEELNPKEIQKSYDYLVSVNDCSKGGSIYIQSKIVVAKKRLEEELKLQQKASKLPRKSKTI